MDITGRIIRENAGLLISQLVYREFSFEEASRFLPLALRSMMEVAAPARELMFLSASEHEATQFIVNSIDIETLAERAGIETDLARAGITGLAPRVLELLAGGEVLPGAAGGLERVPSQAGMPALRNS